MHKVTPEEVNSVNSKFSEFVRNATQFISDLKMGRELYVEGLKAGSFEINYRLEMLESSQKDMYPPPVQKIEEFLNEYFKYIFNKLPIEDDDIFKREVQISEDFRKLLNDLSQIYVSVR